MLTSRAYSGRTDRERPYRHLRRLGQPAAEPVLLSELRLQARVDHTDEDLLLNSYLVAAREYVEKRLDSCLIDTQWEMELDSWPAGGVLRLAKPPFSPTPNRQEIEVEYLNPRLQWTKLVESQPGLGLWFVAHRYRKPPSIELVGPLGAAAGNGGPVRVRWWSGYGDGSTGVPRGLRNAMLMLASAWYLNREGLGGASNSMPHGVDELISIHSWGSYK